MNIVFASVSMELMESLYSKLCAREEQMDFLVIKNECV